MQDLEIQNWVWDYNSKSTIQSRVHLCNQILQHLGSSNDHYKDLTTFMIDTFNNISYIDYNKLLLASKPLTYYSESMQ